MLTASGTTEWPHSEVLPLDSPESEPQEYAI